MNRLIPNRFVQIATYCRYNPINPSLILKERMVKEGRGESTSLTLLDRVKQNEEDAWQRFVSLYGPMIYARCRNGWRLSATDSENIGQEVFTSIARKIGEFHRERAGSLRKWIRIITDNQCKNHFRKRNDHAVGGSEARNQLENLADDTVGPDETISDDDEKHSVLRQALKHLENEFSARDLKIFWCIAVEERHRQIVAEEFGVSDNVVYIVNSRIKKRLREIYEDLMDEDLFRDTEQ